MNKEVSTDLAYKQLLVTIRQQVKSAQAKAAVAVKSSLIQLYWDIGQMIADNQALFEGRETISVSPAAAPCVGPTIQHPPGLDIIPGIPWGHHTAD